MEDLKKPTEEQQETCKAAKEAEFELDARALDDKTLDGVAGGIVTSPQKTPLTATIPL